MEDYLILKILDKFQGIFIKSGIDYKVMRKIVGLKMKMDGRRVPTIVANNTKASEEKNHFKSAMLMYFLIGIFMAIIMLMPMKTLPKMSTVLGVIMFMLITTLVSDFSSVLLDVKDKNILFTKPIDHRTINAAKIIHILNYLVSLSLALAGPSLIIAFIKYGIIFVLVFLIELILINITMILFTSLLYFLLLYFFDGEKLKDIINYFQIFLSIVLIIGYQVMVRVVDFVDMDMKLDLKWWHGLVPSVIFSSPLSIIGDRDFQACNLVFSVLTIVIPIISIIIYMKYVVPNFEKSIQKLNDNSSSNNKKMGRKLKKLQRVAKIVCRNNEEKAAYVFTKNMCGKERDFKLKVYPALAMSLVFPFIYVFIFTDDIQSLANIKNIFLEKNLHFTMYIAICLISTVVPMIMYSEKFKGAWLFNVVPIKNKENIFKGAFKGFTFNYVYPLYVGLSLIYVAIAGPKIIVDLIISLLALNICCLVSFTVVNAYPFSKEISIGNSENTKTTFISIGSALVLGFFHYKLISMNNGRVVVFLLMALLNVIIWIIIFRHKKTYTIAK